MRLEQRKQQGGFKGSKPEKAAGAARFEGRDYSCQHAFTLRGLGSTHEKRGVADRALMRAAGAGAL